ncbi:integrase [Streptomyces phaeochromogenes]|uniref:integrase n=1 Tax=Streptomyces phaeochromogenes TaxID=1923 RepID=UPI00386700F9|nr:site-specific integrase [Streptomyces phaeochromogenes]
MSTRLNYATDIALLLTFLWGRGKSWREAVERDLEDFEYWRTRAPENPERIGGSKWNRELAAFSGLYRWALRERLIARSPVATRQVVGYRGEPVTVHVARAKDSRPSNVHWLTPRTWRLWSDVGLRGFGRDGAPEPGWAGRLEDRNTSFVDLVTSSGLRRQEGAALLTIEIPVRRMAGGRYCHGTVASESSRGKRSRSFYTSVRVVDQIQDYVDSSRSWAVHQAQKRGLYDRVPMRLVTEVTSGLKPRLRWQGPEGRGERALDLLTWQERATLFVEGPEGPEPLWLWLNERGLPFCPHSWNGVFRTANERCRRILTPPGQARDPHRVYAPFATPHAGRHSFALFMLVVLNHVMDRRYGLSPEERRDFRLLYGDPWFMVQGLLGHSSRETTIKHYLAPVRHLQLESLLAAAPTPLDAPALSMDDLFTQVARAAGGIQDIESAMAPVGERV